MQVVDTEVAYGSGGEEMVDEVVVGGNIAMLRFADEGF
jgi:hypothetical protein